MTVFRSSSNKFSIYLAEASAAGYLSQILNLGKSLPGIEMDVLGIKATLYVKKGSPKQSPPWTKLFTEYQEIPKDIFGSRRDVGAALVIYLKSKCFVITFGTGFHLVRNESMVRDFGLRVTLNSVDPYKLRSLDKASYGRSPLNSKTQSPIGLEMFDLDDDSENEMLYAITGESKVPIFGSYVTGRDALTLALKICLEELKDVLLEAISRYEKALPSLFEWIDNIRRVKDKDMARELDSKLDGLLTDGDFSNMWLGEPEVVDWETQIGYSFDQHSDTPRHSVLKLGNLAKYFDNKGETFTSDGLKSKNIHINDKEFNSIKKWSAYRCLYAEIISGIKKYILRKGRWYRVELDFEAAVDRCLKNLDLYNFEFPIYNHDQEKDYNSDVADAHNNIVLMDRVTVKVGGPHDKLEFCDLLKDCSDFIHVKFYRNSSTLSHLFWQGVVASEVFIGDSDFRKRLNEKLPAAFKLGNPESKPDPRRYRVVYAIAANRKMPDELPFLAKVSLKNAVEILETLNFNVALSAIQVDPSIEDKKKIRSKKDENII